MLKPLNGLWNRSTTFRNITTVGFGDLLSQMINVITAVLLIRALSVEDQASFSAMSSAANLTAGLIGSGINLALVRFSTEYASRTGTKLNSIYYFVFVLEIGLFLTITALAMIFPRTATLIVLGNVDYVNSLTFGLLYGMGILLTQLGRSIYQAEENFIKFIGVLLLRQVATLIISLALWALKILSFQTASLTIGIIYILIGLWIFYKSSGIQNYGQFRSSFLEGRTIVKPFLSASGWLIGYFLLLAIIGQIDILTLTRLSNEVELANYGVAARYYSMALIFLGSINSVLLPKFSQQKMQDPNKQRSFTLRWLKISIWLIVPILLFDLFGKPLFVWINKAQYTDAFAILVIFSIGIWLSFMLSPQVNILISRGDYCFLFVVSLIATIVCIFGNFLFIPIWGGVGAGIINISTYNLLIHLPILIKVLRKT